MGSFGRAIGVVLLMSGVAIACRSDDAGTVETTTSTTSSAVTTTAPPPTTTTEPDPCTDVFCVLYEIRPDAHWSDGEPVTASDFAHTYDMLSDRTSGAVDRSGYDLITDHLVIDDKTILFTFSEVYPPWRTLFDVVLPAHYEGEPDAPGAPVTGPFVLEQWLGAERVVLGRNPHWSGLAVTPGQPLEVVDELIFVFPESAEAQIEAIEDGEIDVAYPDPQGWMVEALSAMQGVEHELTPGPFWEHIDFNHDDPMLSQRWVREAMALAIDRERLLTRTVRTIDPLARTLDSAVWLSNSSSYVDNYDHPYDPETAESILTDNGCERGGDGIYTCQGQRLSFLWATTSGDAFREEIFQLAAEDLQAIGIQVVLDVKTPSELFSSSVLFAGPAAWQVINFSWKGEADPHLANSTFYCTGDAPSGYGALNVNRYCNDEVEALIRSTEMIVDQAERQDAYTRADSIYLDDLAMIPLFQRRSLLAWNSEVKGLVPNITDATDLWNAGLWTGKDSVVVGLGSEPETLNPVRPESEDAEVVLASMYEGAYTIDPGLRFVPVLVARAQPMVRGG